MKILLILFATIALQPSRIVFNLPALSGKNYIQVKKILGKPKIDDVPTNAQTTAGVTGDAFFEKDGYTLEVTYNPVNKKINDFFIGMDHPTNDYLKLLAACNLQHSKAFIITRVKSNKNPNLYTGVTITPK